jgi:hypothetical protein
MVPHERWEKWIPGSALTGCPGMTTKGAATTAFSHPTSRNTAATAVHSSAVSAF